MMCKACAQLQILCESCWPWSDLLRVDADGAHAIELLCGGCLALLSICNPVLHCAQLLFVAGSRRVRPAQNHPLSGTSVEAGIECSRAED